MSSESLHSGSELTPDEWKNAEDEERLSHILSGGQLTIEQAREVLEQIDEDVEYERKYLLSRVPANALNSGTERRPSACDANHVTVAPALAAQPSNTLLPLAEAWQWTEESFTRDEVTRQRIRRLGEIELIQQALKKQLETLAERQESRPRTPRGALPRPLPQQTCMEVRNAAIAVADGHSLRRWKEVKGETALAHVIPGDPVSTKLTAGRGLDWWGLPATYGSLRDELQKLELPAVLLLNILIGAALHEQHSTAPLDVLMARMGWTPRNVPERSRMRQKVWRWLLLFDSLTVHGKRPGKYKDRLTGELVNLTSADALIKLTGARGPAQMAFDNSAPPVEVSWVAGPWLDRFRDDRRVLQFFGDIDRIAAIHSRRPSGSWAQSVGLALNQLWRERARHAKVARSGEDNRLTVIYEQPFTRLELLDMFRAEPWVYDVLNSKNPQRAKQYWLEAMRILKHDVGMIGYYKIKTSAGAPNKRQGWQSDWLRQELEIRPKGDWAQAAAELAKKGSRRYAPRKKNAAPSLY